VSGEQHYLEGFRKIAGRRRGRGYLQPVEVDLVREPNNVHDSNAIPAEVGTVRLGYVAREVAVDLAPQLDEAGLEGCRVPGIVRGGYSKTAYGGATDFGLHLWLDAVLEPAGLVLSAPSAPVAAWPPKVWEGRGVCPECGGFKWMQEAGPGRLFCERCGRVWAEQAPR
jgi:hypothetical protein